MMSTLTPSREADAPGTGRSGPVPGVTQWRVIRAEWIKLWSVRSSRIGFLAAIVVSVGLGVAFAAVALDDGPGPADRSTDPVSLSLAGFFIGQVWLGVLAVLAVTSEYATGLVRATFSAVPTRVPVLRAKAAVYGGVTLAVTAAGALFAFLVGQALYGGTDPTVALSDPGALRTVAGTAVYGMGIALAGVALGFLLRSTAGGIGVLVAALIIVPNLGNMLPDSWSDPVLRFLPSNAGSAFSSFRPPDYQLSPTMGLVVFAAWILGLLAAAQVSLRLRDA